MTRPIRKLIVCCDGTWNKRDSGKAPTNVAKMARAIRPLDQQDISQLIYYHPGVGTGDPLDSTLGGMFGVGLAGNVQSAYAFLVDNFLDGDQIFMFGFSRGAFTARSLAGLVSLAGLMEKLDMEFFPQLFKIYQSREYREPILRGKDPERTQEGLRTLFPEGEKNGDNDKLLAALDRSRRTSIFFVGVWDTVGSLGVPAPFSWLGASKFNFHNTDLSENIVYAYHALAIDESRKFFPPTLWLCDSKQRQTITGKKRAFEQVWFAGCHSNVGGGYDEAGLSDIAFLWMAAKAARASLEQADRPLDFDDTYLKQKISQAMGTLVNSRTGKWRFLGTYLRPLFAPRSDGRETCELIHSSVFERYKCADQSRFAPFPYRPANAVSALAKADQSTIAALSDFEKTYRVVA